MSQPGLIAAALVVMGCGLVLTPSPPGGASAAAQPPSSQPRRLAVARVLSAAGSFASRLATGTEYRPLPAEADIHSTDRLVAFPGASLVSKNGRIALAFPGDLFGDAPAPIYDTVCVLHPAEEVDLDVTLESGRLVVGNTAAEGAATCRLRFWNQTWTIALETPETRLLLDLSSRWPAGTRFQPRKMNRPGSATPVATALLVVLKGQATVDVGGVALALTAPPGPAELRWDSLHDPPRVARKLEQLPPWADPQRPLTPPARALAETFDRFRQLFAREPDQALTRFATAKELLPRLVALHVAQALDVLEHLEQTLNAPATKDEWDLCVTLLRHWIARQPNHDQFLYDFLLTRQQYAPAEGRIFLQLLLGFSEDDLRQTETYQVLLDYLTHEKATLRNLAAWHLLRLLPEAQRFPYKPAGSREDALRVRDQWKQLLPPPSLPSPGKER
ncbi:hypothetical protein [Thermogemmata fonticola]|uniref:Uncharacterized protein n=1 Tax=Thermogemmata fonticola TaxID=2755323 RepID=A0A7V9AAH5_9BACT|nr:hypothetical protein [Thermogemmata fonticola]MBA2225048.1 hypothetical protein [Thermogemmata fonticola]